MHILKVDILPPGKGIYFTYAPKQDTSKRNTLNSLTIEQV